MTKTKTVVLGNQLLFGQVGVVVDINSNMPLLIWSIFANCQGGNFFPSSSYWSKVKPAHSSLDLITLARTLVEIPMLGFNPLQRQH